MDEFKKPYEYDEEKGTSGMLLIFFFLLIAIEPFIGILSFFVFNGAIKGSNVLSTVLSCATALFIIFSVFSGISLKRVSKRAIQVVKVFLVFRLLYLVPVVYINMRSQVDAIPYDKAYPQYAAEYNSFMTSFLVSMSYVLIFSVFWYIYLNKSKKVKEIFPQSSSELKTVA